MEIQNVTENNDLPFAQQKLCQVQQATRHCNVSECGPLPKSNKYAMSRNASKVGSKHARQYQTTDMPVEPIFCVAIHTMLQAKHGVDIHQSAIAGMTMPSAIAGLGEDWTWKCVLQGSRAPCSMPCAACLRYLLGWLLQKGTPARPAFRTAWCACAHQRIRSCALCADCGMHVRLIR